MRNISQNEWIELIANDDNAIIIDVRQPQECETGIIENAVMMNIMDFQDFQRKASQLDSNKNYYVYCKSGVRSVTACNVLEALGLDTTYNLLGGILEWNDKTVIPKI
jgi:rhodanese-related sulfurtransferase